MDDCADLVKSATLVAMTATEAVDGITEGALYFPVWSTVPAPVDGFNDQVTDVFDALETALANCCVWPWKSEAVAGETVTPTGFKVMVDVAVFEVSAWLVAVTVTAVVAATVAGAVYSPEVLIDPVPVGLMVQFTVVYVVFVTAAVNCWVCPPPSVAVAGVTDTPTARIGLPVTLKVKLPLMRMISATIIMFPEAVPLPLKSKESLLR